MLLTKEVAGMMRINGGGRIINISSVAGLSSSGSSIPYAVSKVGLIHLTKCMVVARASEIWSIVLPLGYLDAPLTANSDVSIRKH